MKSPFRRYANAVLSIPRQGEFTIEDPETGNRIPHIEFEQMRAMLNATDSKDDNKTKQLYGVDAQSIYVEGYLTEPMFFPEGISPPMEIECELNGVRGSLEITLYLNDSYGAWRKTGQPIRGYFKVAK